jgi:phosphoglucomutase
MDLLAQSIARANAWLNSSVVDTDSKDSIKKLLADGNPKQLIDSFYKELEFGTGGLRGIMGVGSNCMNKYTLGAATQGLANYLKKSLPGKEIKVAVAYDSRNNSALFAQVTADVFSANGIIVYLFPELRPTPLLSFAIRHLQCDSGVVITASHNPKEYNGYKAYWSDGAQLVPPHDENVIDEVNSIGGFENINFQSDASKISRISKEVEEAYYHNVKRLIPAKESIKRQHAIPLVYSSLHGAGITMVPECLSQLGFTNLILVDEQSKPDGNFPTVLSPNPEEQSAMELALKKAKEVNAELVMATDPDTDRVGIAIKNNSGNYFLLNGNQAFSLMMWFIIKNLSDNEKKNGYIAKTIVTTELVDTIASKMGIECFNTLTGFKYIAELMGKMDGKKTFVAAGEESYGYMVGDFVRDKDAVSACAFFAALAASAKDEGQTLYDWLVKMYVDFGFYKEGLVNLVKKGAEGEQEIKKMMEKFRSSPPIQIAGKKIVRTLDYKTGIEKNVINKSEIAITLPKSDVIQFYLEDGTKISVRPSGTEPKIKFYISVNTQLKSPKEFDLVNQQLNDTIESIKSELLN